MENKETDFDELSDKVMAGMKIAIRKLVETSAANNRSLVIGDREGNIRRVPAKDLLDSVRE